MKGLWTPFYYNWRCNDGGDWIDWIFELLSMLLLYKWNDEDTIYSRDSIGKFIQNSQKGNVYMNHMTWFFRKGLLTCNHNH